MTREIKTFTATLDSLEPIREFIIQKCAAKGMSKKKWYGLILALDEVATNIINYGYSSKKGDNKIDMIVDDDETTLTITLEDEAVEFNPLKHNMPGKADLNAPLEERDIGGLGIFLAIKNVDEFRYEFLDHKNRNIFKVVV